MVPLGRCSPPAFGLHHSHVSLYHTSMERTTMDYRNIIGLDHGVGHPISLAPSLQLVAED